MVKECGQGSRTYEHPSEYKGIKNQAVIKLFIEENCLKCEEFCGSRHDFENCKPLGDRCPKPVTWPLK